MSKIKAILGYAWAGLLIPVTLVTFIGMPGLAEALVSATGVRISPWYDGGAVVRTVEHGTYAGHIHEPVFQALIGERPHGFVQIAWAPAEALPAQLSEDVDYNGDGHADFRLHLDVANDTADVTSLGAPVLGIEGPYRVHERVVVRVRLQRSAR